MLKLILSYEIFNLILLLFCLSSAQANNIYKKIETLSSKVEKSVVKWRRHIHQNPELSNREFMTAKYVADHLRSLGIEIKEKVAHTGVVGIIKGGKPGPVVALRADMDALPVTERVDIPFASKVTTIYKDVEVGVMHACGHDTHVAILMGVASVLKRYRRFARNSKAYFPTSRGGSSGRGRRWCRAYG